MTLAVGALAVVAAMELVVIFAIDRYAHGLAERVESLERSATRPAPRARAASRTDFAPGVHEKR